MTAGGVSIVFRCDASATLGFGHVSRCLSVAAALRSLGARTTFLSRRLDDTVQQRVVVAGHEWQPLEATNCEDEVRTTVGLARRATPAVVVTDSHRLAPKYYLSLHEAGVPVVSFDDYAGVAYASDVVINPNLGADALPFVVAPYTQVLKGPRFLPLREAVCDLVGTSRAFGARVEHILVALGGMPEPDVAGRVLDGLRSWTERDGVRVTVVAGIRATEDEIAAIRRHLPGGGQVAVDPDLPALMAGADLAIVNGSVTAYEAAAIGTPSLALAVAENQRLAVEALEREGAAAALPPADRLTAEAVAAATQGLAADPARRRALSARARELVDGRGTDRVVAIVLQNAAMLRY